MNVAVLQICCTLSRQLLFYYLLNSNAVPPASPGKRLPNPLRLSPFFISIKLYTQRNKPCFTTVMFQMLSRAFGTPNQSPPSMLYQAVSPSYKQLNLRQRLPTLILSDAAFHVYKIKVSFDHCETCKEQQSSFSAPSKNYSVISGVLGTM